MGGSHRERNRVDRPGPTGACGGGGGGGDKKAAASDVGNRSTGGWIALDVALLHLDAWKAQWLEAGCVRAWAVGEVEC